MIRPHLRRSCWPWNTRSKNGSRLFSKGRRWTRGKCKNVKEYSWFWSQNCPLHMIIIWLFPLIWSHQSSSKNY